VGHHRPPGGQRCHHHEHFFSPLLKGTMSKIIPTVLKSIKLIILNSVFTQAHKTDAISPTRPHHHPIATDDDLARNTPIFKGMTTTEHLKHHLLINHSGMLLTLSFNSIESQRTLEFVNFSVIDEINVLPNLWSIGKLKKTEATDHMNSHAQSKYLSESKFYPWLHVQNSTFRHSVILHPNPHILTEATVTVLFLRLRDEINLLHREFCFLFLH
jgi:hypothetical protein